MKENDRQIREQVRALVESQPLAVLSTSDHGSPYASLVAFAVNGDLEQILFATPRSTRKYANICGNPDVALLIDSRTNREEDFHEAAAVTVLGKAHETQGDERRQHAERYLRRQPHLEEFVNAPTTALFVVDVRSYYLVTRFQHVMELHMKSDATHPQK